MMPLTTADVMPNAEYEQIRGEFRARIIALKHQRRIAVGDQIALVFENRDTVRFQVQEMLRTEHISAPDKIQDELNVYNALLPQDGELSATLFIEITDHLYIQRDLERFRGIDRGQTVALVMGQEEVWGEFEGGHSNEEKISAVHFVKFRPSPRWIAALQAPHSPATIAIRHAHYSARSPVPPALRSEWMHDLRAEHREGR